MDNGITQKIQLEIDQIDELINESRPIFNLCKIREPDFVERCGIALILQSFYNGIEKLLLLIIKHKNIDLPKGNKWHKELFDIAFKETNSDIQVFRNELNEPLYDYLQFRHFVRHSYGFQLMWERMEQLLFDMNNIWNKAKEDIIEYLKNN